MNLTEKASVYCLRRGLGNVHSVDGNLAYVRFADKIIPYSRKNLAETGQSERTLYWHNPITVAPPEDKAKWESLKLVIANVAKLVESK